MKTLILAAVMAVLAGTGCDRKPAKLSSPSATYKGKPAEEWVKLANDADTKTRMAAYEALMFVGPPGELRSHYFTEWDTDAKAMAAKSMIYDSEQRGEVVKFVLSIINDSNMRSYLTSDHVYELVGSLVREYPADAAPVLNALKKIVPPDKDAPDAVAIFYANFLNPQPPVTTPPH